MFGGEDEPEPEPEPEPEAPELPWIEAADNPWGVRILDVRPITLTTLLASSDPRCARNAVSFAQEDGGSFVGERPPVDRVIAAALRFPIDRMLADGVLFAPREMEHKWALFVRRGQILCVRSWTRQVAAIARVEPRGDHVVITQVQGTLTHEDEAPEFTVRVLDFLLRSHALAIVHPAPLPRGLESNPHDAAQWCMSMFGNLAWYATPHAPDPIDPDRPLRTHSLLHIAVAHGDRPAIEEQLAAGVPIDLLAGDGLAPLHWALAADDPMILAFLLDRGSPVDVRSEEGATPLMNAVQDGTMIQVRLLLDRGADVNACDHRGFTALHRAAEKGHLDVTRLLLDRGANPAPDAGGHTPRSLAEGRGRKEIVALLEQHITGGG
jgi:hypothetical protein